MFLPGLIAAVIAQAESQALRDAARAIEDTNALIDSLAALEQLDNLRSSTSHLRGSHEGGGDGDAGVFDPSSVSSHAPPADATATAPVLPKRMGAAAWHPTWSPPSDAVVVGEDAAPRAVPRELPAALPLSTLHAHWGTSATTAAKHAANHGVQGAAVADLARNPELNPCKCVEGDTCDWKKTTPVRLEFCFVFLCKQVVRIHSPFPAAFLPPSCCLRSACICGARAYRRPSPTHSLDSPSVLASSLSLSLLPTSLLLSLFLFYPTLPLLLAHTLSRTHTHSSTRSSGAPLTKRACAPPAATRATMKRSVARKSSRGHTAKAHTISGRRPRRHALRYRTYSCRPLLVLRTTVGRTTAPHTVLTKLQSLQRRPRDQRIPQRSLLSHRRFGNLQRKVF